MIIFGKLNSIIMFYERELYGQIKLHIEKKEFTVITGARQAGKTTLLRKLYSELREEGKSVSYLSLEDPGILAAANEHPEQIFKFSSRPKNPLTDGISQKIFVLIDEIQYLTSPTGFLKYLYDTYAENLKLIVTGSSAFYLDTRFKDSLAGRKRIFMLETLNFDEFLLFKNQQSLIEELAKIRNSKEYISPFVEPLNQYLEEYIIYGGYPAVVLESDFKDKKARLSELRNSFIKKDILEAGLGNEEAFFRMMKLLASQTGNLVNKSELSSTLRIDARTVENYLYVMQKCFHIVLIRPFFSNLRKELVKMPKVYFSDTGLRNTLLNNFSPIADRTDKGALLENYLLKRLSAIYGHDEVMFWRTASGHEVDFIVKEGLTRKAFEAKFGNQKPNHTSVKAFKENYPDFSFLTLSWRPGDENTWILKI
jgi:predicted AAA+ superfamily ATPase